MIINNLGINFAGGTGGGGGDSKVIGTKDFTVTANGQTNITMDQGVDGISGGTINTNVQPSLTAATFDQNGTYTPPSGVDGFSEVTVAIDGSENRLNKYFTDNITAITQSDLAGAYQLRDFAFYNMSNLVSVDLPSSVTRLNQSAFSRTGIQSIDVSNINMYTNGLQFERCTNLSAATGFENFTGNLPRAIFSGCTKLNGDFKLGVSACTESDSFNGCTGITSFTFVNSFSGVFGSAWNNSTFKNCTGVEYMDFTHNIAVPTLANTDLFTSFTQNYEIRVPQTLYNAWTTATNWSNANIVSHIVAYPDVYSACSITYTTTDGNDITPNTAYASTAWTGTYLSSEFDAVTGGTVNYYGYYNVPNQAFKNKATLASLQFGEGLRKLGASAVTGCYAVTTLDFPDSMTEIDTHALLSCTGITSLSFGTGFTTFGSYAIDNLASLESITFRSSTPPNRPYVSIAPPANVTIYCPRESVPAYTTWKNYVTQFRNWTVEPISD